MRNFIIAAAADLVLILASYFLFRSIISGPTRHRLYEKFMSSFAKFVIYIFVASAGITALTALILYRTRYISYLNIAAPALVSLLVGFIVSTVPTRGIGDEKKKEWFPFLFLWYNYTICNHRKFSYIYDFYIVHNNILLLLMLLSNQWLLFWI